MDSLPKTIRTPPAKPPRRNSSDQFSITGTLQYKKIEDSVKSPVKEEIPLVVDNSAASNDSFPTSWSSEISLEKISDGSYACSEQNIFKENCSRIFTSENIGQIKKSIKMCDIELTKSNGWRDIFQRNHQFFPNFKIDILSAECSSIFSSKYFHNKFASLNRVRMVLNEDNGDLNSISCSRNFHRRQNSDPLPSNSLSKDSSSFSPTSQAYRIHKQCECEYAHESSHRKFLLQEIKSLKAMNHKLWEHLCCAQAILEKFMNNSCDHKNAVSFSDLLLSLYDSLRARDTAMENRMKLILLERNDAIQNLDNMIQIATRNFEDIYAKDEDITSSDKEIKILLREIDTTSNPAKLIQLQKLLLSHLYRSKELKLDQTLHEMQFMILERDNLQLKVQLLENKLSQLQKSSKICEYDKRCWESSLLNILCQTIQQRDTVLKNRDVLKVKHFNKSSVYEKSAELNTSLQNSASTCVAKKMLISYENNLEKSKSVCIKTSSDNLKCLDEEIFLFNESFEEEFEKREFAEEKSFRLNKLVKILQQKLDGKNIGILV